jgi:hypothetical protein
MPYASSSCADARDGMIDEPEKCGTGRMGAARALAAAAVDAIAISAND